MSPEPWRPAPTSRLTGYRPPSTAGAMRSMTTVRRGASIGRVVTAGSGSKIEGESRGERRERVARVGPLPPEQEEAVLGRPVTVRDAEAPRALDERGRAGDALARRLLGDGVEGLGDRPVHDEPQRREIERQPERARVVDEGDDARRDRAELRQGLERGGDLPPPPGARDGRQPPM